MSYVRNAKQLAHRKMKVKSAENVIRVSLRRKPTDLKKTYICEFTEEEYVTTLLR